MTNYKRGVRELAELESKFVHGGASRGAGNPGRRERLRVSLEAIEDMLESGDMFVGDDEYEGWEYV